MKPWIAESADGFGVALREAFACKEGPCQIETHAESIADRVPPVYSWLMKRGMDPLALEADDVSFL